MNREKLLHDYQSDLASLKEGLNLLDQNPDEQLKEKVLQLLIIKCSKISADIAKLQCELEQRVKS